MKAEKQLVRSRNALVGGVCAGVADYFGFDPVIARIITVVLALATVGLVVVAYVALWVVLPLAPSKAGPVEVEPHSVHSETYGPVDVGVPQVNPNKEDSGISGIAGAQQYSPYGAYVSAGHMPPTPPAPVVAAWAQQAYTQTFTGWSAPDTSFVAPTQPPSASFVPPQAAPPFQAPVPPSSFSPTPLPAQPSASRPKPQPAPTAKQSSNAKGAVLAGVFMLFFGIASLLAGSSNGIAWWQFWPLVLSIIGIIQMVIPGPQEQRINQFVDGLMLFSLGTTLLFFSLGIAKWESLQLMFLNLWPLLFMMVGCFIIGGALHSPWWTLLAGLCFVLFCILGIVWFALAGPNEVIVLTLPYGRELVLPFEASTIVIR